MNRKIKSYLYGALVFGFGMSCVFEKEAMAVTKFIASLKPQEIKSMHQEIKERLDRSQNPKEKDYLKGQLLKFEKYYISPDDYTLDVSIQNVKGNAASFNVIATTNENKRFSPEYPCEAKGSFNGDAIYVQPKLDVDKKGEIFLKLSIVLGQEEFLIVVPYKNDMEVKDDQKSASGPLKVTAKLKIKNKGFWG